MKKGLRLALPFAVCLFSASAVLLGAQADSTRGARVFEAEGCIQCHALNGVGAGIGPDLGRIADRGFTPASFTGLMWNHAPAMWNAMRQRNIQPAGLDEDAAADLFAFFYSMRFFEEEGDAARGKRVFTSRQCSTCHGIDKPVRPDAKPVSQWTSTSDPLDLVEAMWNHAPMMRNALARTAAARRPAILGQEWPKLSSQEFADLLVYIRPLSSRQAPPAFHEAAPSQAPSGQILWMQIGCNACHGEITHFMAVGLRGETLTDIAADMWNHGRDMSLSNAQLPPGGMKEIASYIWSERMRHNDGIPSHGASVFVAKKCAVCHNDPASGAPAIVGKRQFSSVTMVAALTHHGPAMLDRMRAKNITWPRFAGSEMSDLIAYLNAGDSRNAR
jgi:cytochrome c2